MTTTLGVNGDLVAVVRAGKSYPGVTALLPLSLRIGEGERVALVGPSGSGKTTLLYLLAGLVQPDSGSVTIGGRPLAGLTSGKELAGLVSIMHQSYDLVPQLPVVHNVLAGRLGQWGLLSSIVSLVRAKDRHLAVEALSRLGIEDKLHERTSQLSGGEQQRVAIARLMVQSSQVILADEPVSSLDPARAEDMLGLLTSLVGSGVGSGENVGEKVLVASLHAPDLIRKYFDRVIGLRQGALRFDVPTKELDDGALRQLYSLGGQGPSANNRYQPHTDASENRT